jgi:NADP-dependent 3-hydroxy acid dehydrogenase YdfG
MQSRILADEGHTPDSETLIDANDIAAMVLAAVKISRTAEVTDIVIRPRRPMKREGSGA